MSGRRLAVRTASKGGPTRKIARHESVYKGMCVDRNDLAPDNIPQLAAKYQ
jgi:hypothetical protein